MDILFKTLEQMPDSFSSNEFSNKAKKNGLTQKEIENGVISLFLHRNAKQGFTRRMWIKVNKSQVNINFINKAELNKQISDAIQLLKSNNYKIFKYTEI